MPRVEDFDFWEEHAGNMAFKALVRLCRQVVNETANARLAYFAGMIAQACSMSDAKLIEEAADAMTHANLGPVAMRLIHGVGVALGWSKANMSTEVSLKCFDRIRIVGDTHTGELGTIVDDHNSLRLPRGAYLVDVDGADECQHTFHRTELRKLTEEN